MSSSVQLPIGLVCQAPPSCAVSCVFPRAAHQSTAMCKARGHSSDLCHLEHSHLRERLQRLLEFCLQIGIVQFRRRNRLNVAPNQPIEIRIQLPFSNSHTRSRKISSSSGDTSPNEPLIIDSPLISSSSRFILSMRISRSTSPLSSCGEPNADMGRERLPRITSSCPASMQALSADKHHVFFFFPPPKKKKKKKKKNFFFYVFSGERTRLACW